MGLHRAARCDTDRFGLATLREVLRDVAVARHQGQDLVPAAQRPRVSRDRGVVSGRLHDPGQQCRLASVLRPVARERLAEVVLAARGEAVAAVAQVDEAGVACEDLALGALRRAVAPPHLLLEPEGQAHLLQLPQELVGAGYAQDRGEESRRQAAANQHVGTLAAGQIVEEVAADELLRERRAPVAEPHPEPRVAGSRRGQGAPRGLLQHSRQGAVVDAGVDEEVLVLGREDGVSENGRDLVVGHHTPVFPRQSDEHRPSGIVDLADRRRREADEGLEVRQPAAVEEDVVGEAHRGQEEQGQERHREAGRATPARGRHPRGSAAPDDAEPRGHRGAAVGQPSEVGPEPACGPHRLGSGVWRGPFGKQRRRRRNLVRRYRLWQPVARGRPQMRPVINRTKRINNTTPTPPLGP